MNDRALRRLVLASFGLNILLIGLLARHRIAAKLAELVGDEPSRAAAARERRRSASARFRAYPTQPESIVFLGDSLTAEAPLGEMFSNLLNRGIPGDTTADVLARLDETSARQAKHLVVLIGINDLARGIPPETVLQNTETLLAKVRRSASSTRLTLVSILPIRDGSLRGVTNELIADVNERLAAMASKGGAQFLDAFSALAGPDGQLRAEYTDDGLHLLPPGYWALRSLLLPVVGSSR